MHESLDDELSIMNKDDLAQRFEGRTIDQIGLKLGQLTSTEISMLRLDGNVAVDVESHKW